jgi:thiol-disulfide isomerase/thioredoxin
MKYLLLFPVVVFCLVNESIAQNQNSGSFLPTTQISMKVLESLAQNTGITIKTIGGNGEKVVISSTTMISGRDTLAKIGLNAAGIAEVLFSLTSPIFATIQIGNKTELAYLQPNITTELSVDLTKENSFFVYQGQAAEINNYLQQSAQIVKRHLIVNGKYINEFEPKEFTDGLDRIEKALADFHQKYTAQTSLSDEMQEFLKMSARMFPLSFKQNYIAARFYTSTGKTEVPLRLEKMFGDIPYNDVLVLAKNEAYATVLYYLLRDIKAKFYFEAAPEERQNIFVQIPKLTAVAVKQGKYPPAVTEFLMALNAYQALDLGINDIAASLYSDFVNSYPSSFYISSIDRKYQKWATLSKGKTAPDITGVTPEGKKISLSDLKGKIVYTDIWATWCAPCREELPKAKEIQKQFASNDKVVFLYVSVDSQANKWKDFLKADPDFKGTHINIADEKQVSNLYKAYQMAGVPTYLLIDQDGKIATAPAPRPSSGKVEDEIRALLK